MSKILHFLNGDSTKHIFDQTDIEGDVAVMRETFCMGPLNNHRSEDIVDIRKAWFAEHYFTNNDTYHQRISSESDKLKNNYDEIIIWYEYDVYCQINMIALVHAALISSNARIKLVYSPTGIGRLSPSELTALYKSAMTTTDVEQQLCFHIWMGLEFNDLSAVHQTIKEHPPTLPNLSNALRSYIAQNHGAHELRPIQVRIMGIIQSGITNGKQIVGQLLRTDNIFGYGDLQYMVVLTSMVEQLEFERIAANDIEGFIEGVLEREFTLR